jgi:hypothetical protein
MWLASCPEQGLTATMVTTATTFTPCEDFVRWSENGQDVPTSDMQWEFSSPRHHHHGSPCVRFSVHHNTSEPSHTFHIHKNLALALGYLDADYWLSPIKPTTPWNRNRIARYLWNLREDVVKELEGVTGNATLDPTFSTDVLREWAIRVHDRYGHSQTGRKEYLESCARLGTTPYIADFINYGESEYSHVIKIQLT